MSGKHMTLQSAEASLDILIPIQAFSSSHQPTSRIAATAVVLGADTVHTLRINRLELADPLIPSQSSDRVELDRPRSLTETPQDRRQAGQRARTSGLFT